MVRLSNQSNIDSHVFPFAFSWDQKVRKYYQMYQDLIDKQTYQIQRLQRFWFSLTYPRMQDSQLVTLSLLKKKQRVGEVTSQQLQMYKNIQPNAASYFKRAFNVTWGFSIFGIGAAAGLFAYSTLFNFTIPTRIACTAVPLILDFYYNTKDVKSQVHTSEFLDWVYNYRKAISFAQRHKHIFNTPQLRKVLGANSNLVELGEQFVKMATH